MFRDRVYESSSGTGTGNFTLDGAPSGFRTFSAAFTSGTAYYLITNQAVASEWEVGTFSVSGTTLARVAGNVLAGSSGAGVLVNFSAGTKNVYNTVPASALLTMQPSSILTTVVQDQYQDLQSANCGGVIPNGNCASNSNWAMPNGNWWSWGLSITRGNPSGFDFAGGTTTTNTALGTINQPIYGSYSLYQTQVGYKIYRRNYWNCNCGATNCYSNCNCNCNCDCNCNCSTDS